MNKKYLLCEAELHESYQDELGIPSTVQSKTFGTLYWSDYEYEKYITLLNPKRLRINQRWPIKVFFWQEGSTGGDPTKLIPVVDRHSRVLLNDGWYKLLMHTLKNTDEETHQLFRRDNVFLDTLSYSDESDWSLSVFLKEEGDIYTTGFTYNNRETWHDYQPTDTPNRKPITWKEFDSQTAKEHGLR
jgi:hypothetical protein